MKLNSIIYELKVMIVRILFYADGTILNGTFPINV